MTTEFFMMTHEDAIAAGIEKLRKEMGGFNLAKAEEYIRLHPEETIGYLAKVAILGKEKGPSVAHEFIEEVEAKFPENGLVHHIRGTIYEVEGKREQAIEESKKAMQLNPYSPEIRLTLGTLLNRSKKYDEAIKVWQDILKIDPKMAVAWNSLSKSEFEKGDYKKAINHVTSALMLVEGTEVYYAFLQNRSQIYLASGDLERALDDDNEILKHDPEEGIRHIFSQPDYLAKRGKQNQAIQYGQRALERFPILTQVLGGQR